MKQQGLFDRRKVLVTLSDADAAERQKCVDQDLEFPTYILEDTRCQRAGVSRSYFAGMFRMDQGRELADEACILRSDDWQYAPCTWIDWERCNQIGKAYAAEFIRAVEKVVGERMKQL